MYLLYDLFIQFRKVELQVSVVFQLYLIENIPP